MNVLIFPTDDRSGQASLIYYYAALGHKVFLPKFGTLGLNWARIATWPALLYKSSSDPTKRNLEIHGFDRPDVMFGEDYFVTGLQNTLTISGRQLYPHPTTCELIDFEFENPGIDVFHTLRGGEAYLAQYFDIAKKYFPKAKWVSSTLNQMTSNPGGWHPQNVAKMIPAPYEHHHENVNNVCLMALDFEAELLGVELASERARKGFASFNHNFANRQPVDYKLFCEMNRLLKARGYEEVPNFGGNIRTQGADVRYSEQNGITGNFRTITPPEAYDLTSRLIASVHFKETDWGGGVFYYSLNTETPIITTTRYVEKSNSGKYLVDGKNSIYVNSSQEAADAVIRLTDDSQYATNLRLGMQEVKRNFISSCMSNWYEFLERLL